MSLMDIAYFIETGGRSPFEHWFDALDAQAAAKVVTAMDKLAQDNLASLKSVGQGVLECRIDWGPGYRLYLGRDGPALIILLVGGTKQRQRRDIETAQRLGATTGNGGRNDRHADQGFQRAGAGPAGA